MVSFIFGKDRSGNAELLKKYAKEDKFGFTQLTPHKSDDQIIYSSSAIRKGLKDGDLNLVRKLLGKNYFITGEVIEGKKLGSELGFATANIALKDLFRSRFGVYAVRVHFDN